MQRSDDKDEVGGGEDYERLSAMLSSQMSVVQSLKQLQLEQGQETQHIIRDLSRQIEEFGNRLEFLEERLGQERRETASLREELLLAREYNDSISLTVDMKLRGFEEKLQQLEQKAKQAFSTEDRMASVHAKLLASVRSELKAELLQELKPIQNEWSATHEKLSTQHRGVASDGGEASSTMKLARTPYGRCSGEVEMPDSEEVCSTKYRPTPKPRTIGGPTSRSVLMLIAPTVYAWNSKMKPRSGE